ncbi:MAG TPA: GNAT family N-acetyltransferase [Oscillatoriaceae cyanobacterium]
MEIRPLRPEDDRTAFTCGDADLDRFFHKYAGQNQFKHHIGTTYVAVEAGTIWGYATVSAGHIEIEHLPERLAKRLPRYPLPVLRLARLAVGKDAQGKGIGGALLFAVFKLALAQADNAGCVGVVVDAKPQAVDWYSRFGFAPLQVLEGGSAARPRPREMFLPLNTIQAATSL